MEDFDGLEVATLSFLGLSVAGGAIFGWLSSGNVASPLGGGLIFGAIALFLVIFVALAAAGVSRLIALLSGR